MVELGSLLRGKPCRVYGPSLQILVAGRVRCPDAFVACSAAADKATWLTEPLVVFEVLSDRTAIVDQTTKSAKYRATASIQRYVMLSQDSLSAVIHEHAGDQWIGTLATDSTVVLAMPELGIELPLAAVYKGLTLDILA